MHVHCAKLPDVQNIFQPSMLVAFRAILYTTINHYQWEIGRHSRSLPPD